MMPVIDKQQLSDSAADDLTRLREAIDRSLIANEGAPGSAAFLAIEVSNLATINDLFVEVTDAVLSEIHRRLKNSLRASDVIGRLGGDRFGVVLSRCRPHKVSAATNRIFAAFSTTPILTSRGLVDVALSITSVPFPDQGLTSDEVIRRAETMLDEADRAGRATHTRDRRIVQNREHQDSTLLIDEKVLTDLKEKRLVLAFQPIISNSSGEIDYHECLLHTRTEGGQLVSAADFLPPDDGLGRIGSYVLDQLILEMASNLEVRLGFNLSVADGVRTNQLISRLRGRPDIAGRLVIEISETAVLNNIEGSAQFVNQLRNTGCRIALDHFGIGHCSMSHLQSLAIDSVKIDGSLIRGLDSSPPKQVRLRHLIGLARMLRLRTVALGIETAEELAMLDREGIGYLQGRYCGEPTLDRALPPLPAHLLKSKDDLLLTELAQ